MNPNPEPTDFEVVRWAECGRRTPYATEAEADLVASILGGQPYACSWDEHFHVGHPPAAVRRGGPSGDRRRVARARYDWGKHQAAKVDNA